MLRELLQRSYRQRLSFSRKIETGKVAKADIIIKHFSVGEGYICNQLLKERSESSLMIGVYDGDKIPCHAELPLCFKNITFINRKASLHSIKGVIEKYLDEKCTGKSTSQQHDCHYCRHRTLSPQQAIIAAHYYSGKSAEQIGQVLHINIKTVSTHKRMIMMKFNLSTDYELLSFLHLLRNQPMVSNIFCENVDHIAKVSLQE
ncbi:helix-turn-helix domain-containing protein [Buttiauxella sp. WJP83]|uniref:helix-turn-helix transcriptional regulator n=1 Tax=Buttiauxella sp. WJP83 TaxID=2986951 RepID=UPI0022DE9000|nr:helix-turn-helix domain-containing protein [Buttiauxella sp. WJP83]WBM72472.1 helix-turn-helix domain-containing protein [Buttiauxella sp. WJP83]